MNEFVSQLARAPQQSEGQARESIDRQTESWPVGRLAVFVGACRFARSVKLSRVDVMSAVSGLLLPVYSLDSRPFSRPAGSSRWLPMSPGLAGSRERHEGEHP